MDTKKTFIFLLMGLFMISIVSAEWYNPFTWFGDDYDVERSNGWYLQYTHGIQEEYFDTTIEQLENGKANVCLWPKELMRINDPIIQQSRATLRKNNVFTRQIEPSDMEVETEGGNVKKMCVNVDPVFEDYIKFGEHSIVVEYTTELATIKDGGDTIMEVYLITEDFEYKDGKPHINRVAGYNEIHTLKFVANANLTNVLSDLKIIDMNTGNETDKKIDIKVRYNLNVEINTTEVVCENTNGTEVCQDVVNGSYIDIEYSYMDLSYVNYSLNMTEGEEIYITYFANLKDKEYGDLVPSIVGVEFDFWASWTANTSIVNGFSVGLNQDDHPSISAWECGEQWCAILGFNFAGDFKGFTWNESGSIWNLNTTVVSGLVETISEDTDVFEIDGKTHLFVGGSNPNPNPCIQIYTWNGAGWDENASMETGLNTCNNIATSPTVMEIDDEIIMIITITNTNPIGEGYQWNGTGWEENSTLVTGLAKIETQHRGEMFYDYNSSDYYMVMYAGFNGGSVDNGKPYGYVWNGAGWTANTTIVNSLTTYTGGILNYVRPDSFQTDNLLYFFTGTKGTSPHYFAHDIVSLRPTSIITMILDTPTNATVYNTNNLIVDFKCKAIDNKYDIDNITFAIYNNTNDEQLYTSINTDGENDTLETFPYTIKGGTNYSWNCFGVNNQSLGQWNDTNNTIIVYAIPDKAPNIEDNSTSVANGSVFLTSPQSLDFYANNVYDDINLSNVSLQVDNGTGFVTHTTNTSGINNTNYAFEGISFTDGNYDWRIIAIDNVTQTSVTNISNFIVDSISPVITVASPVDLFEVTTFNESVNLTWSVVENNPDYCNYNIGGSNTSLSCSGGTTTFNYPITNPDNVTLTVFAKDLYNRTDTEVLTIVRNTDPPFVTETGLVDLSSLNPTVNSSWSVDASDDNLEICWYNTTDHAKQVVTCNASLETEWATDGVKDITYCANDTLGNIACDTDNITIYLVGYTQTDIDPIAEGFTSTFTLNLSATNMPSTQAYLVLDSVVYNYDRKYDETNYDLYEVDVSIPDGLGNTTGVSQDWYWVYNVTGLYTDEVTTTTDITIYALEIDDCSVYGDVILDLDLRDEQLNTLVNASDGTRIEVDVSIISSENSSFVETFNLTWEDENNVTVCVPSGLLGTYEYEIDVIAGFQATDHVWEFFHLDAGTLDATKVFDDYTTSQITFYDLLTTDSTSFLFKYFDQDGLPVESSIVHVFRKYIGEGLFREVERSKADDNGETIVHLVEEDAIYYFLITLDGELQYTSNLFTALCQTTPCEVNLEATGGVGENATDIAEFPDDWDLVDDGGFSISSDSATRSVTLDYYSNGTTSNVWNFTLYRYEDGAYTLVVGDSESGVSGDIDLSVPQSAGNVSFFASVHRDDEFVTSEWVNFEDKVQDRLSIGLSIFLAVLIILTLGLMAVSEGVGTIAMVMFGLFLSGALGLLSTSLSTGVNIVVYLILAGGILIIKLTGQRR